MSEYMDQVDEDNKVVGKITKEEVYSRKLPHRIVHILVINPKSKRIYFQQRSPNVSFLPGYYCTSAGGHVKSGETYEEAAKRELKEELGLETDVYFGTEFKFVSGNHVRFIQLFVTYAGEGFSFTDGEVSGGEFFSFDEAEKIILKNEKIHPQLKPCFEWFISHRSLFGV